MPVPFIDLGRITQKVSEAVWRDWHLCMGKSWFVGGELVQKFESRIQDYLEAKNFVSCANGTDALIIALQALGIKRGMKVALPNLTFWATFEAVMQVGAIPILIDVDPADLQMDFFELVQAHHEFHLDAVVLVHLFGWCSKRLHDFRDFCAKNKIPLIEDGAQAFGVRQDRRSIFSDSLISTLSFYPTKVFGGIMDGGGIATRDHEIAERCQILSDHGRSDHYSYSQVGWNSRMSCLQAAYLSRLLEFADSILENRQKSLRIYKALIQDYLRNKMRLFEAPSGVEGNGYLLVLTAEKPSGVEIEKRLKKKGIGCGRIYPETIERQAPAERALRFSSLKNSQEFCERVVNLPLFYGILKSECQEAVFSLKNVLEELENLNVETR